MVHRTTAFTAFLSPIQLLYRVTCWAPPPAFGQLTTQKYMNLLCVSITLAHFVVMLVSIFQFQVFSLPDDFTNHLVIIIIELGSTTVMLESFVHHSSYQQIFKHFVEFDEIMCSSVPQIDMDKVYSRWKDVYYQKVFSRFVFVMVCHVAGWMLYYQWNHIHLVGILLVLVKITINTKTSEIAFYMDMVGERLALVKAAMVQHNGQQLAVAEMYALLAQICAELNQSLGLTVIVLYLQSVVDLVNICHIMYWNIVRGYTNVKTIGLVAFAITVMMPMCELIQSCEWCKKKVIKK